MNLICGPERLEANKIFRYMCQLFWEKIYQLPKCNTVQKMKLSIKDLFSKYDPIHSFLQIWSYLLKKYLMKNFIFCAKLQ